MAEHKPHIVFWNNIPSPYFVQRMNAVTERGNLQIEAWFNAERTAERSWKVDPREWKFSARFIPQRKLLGRKLNVPLAELRAVRPDVLISLYDRPEFALGSLASRVTAGRTAYRALPNYETWSTRTWYGELGKNLLFRSLDGAIVPGPTGREMTMKYGLPTDRSYDVTQTINIDHFAQARNILPEKRQEKREALGLTGCVFIYVGRLWSGKGLDDLVEAYRHVQAQHPDVSLLLVGDGVEEERYRQMTSDLANVVYTGFIQSAQLPEYYALADVSIFPTLGDPHGLVVEESMAAGLPMICTENAGDIRLRLPDGKVGYIVPIQDAATLADRMLKLARDEGLRHQFAAGALRLVAHKNHTTYAQDFERFIEQLMAKPVRRSPTSFLARGIGSMLMLTSAAKADPAPYFVVEDKNRPHTDIANPNKEAPVNA